MIEKKDEMEQFINSELQKEADRIEREVGGESGGEVSQNHISSVKSKLDEQIHDIEVEKIIAQLPKDEQDAYKLGKEMQREGRQEEQANEKEKRAASKRKKRKIYAGAAAAAMVFMAVGITSFGGAEKVVRIMKSVVGSRKISQVDSSESNAISVEEKEEEAYQKVKDELGIEPVKITIRPKGMKFKKLYIDLEAQTAELLYLFNEKAVTYYISLAFADSSLGMDVDDSELAQWTEEKKGCQIEMKEYLVSRDKGKKYSAQFQYNKVDYFLNASMEKENFEIIIKNLHFL